MILQHKPEDREIASRNSAMEQKHQHKFSEALKTPILNSRQDLQKKRKKERKKERNPKRESSDRAIL